MKDHNLTTGVDPMSGSRMFYKDKNNRYISYLDNRELQTTLCDGRALVIKPDLISEATKLPFPNESKLFVVYDPPHLIRAGEKSWLKLKYGKLPENWQTFLRDSFAEAMRILKVGGILIAKWNTDQIPYKDFIKAIGKSETFGDCGRGHGKAKTLWLFFIKEK